MSIHHGWWCRFLGCHEEEMEIVSLREKVEILSQELSQSHKQLETILSQLAESRAVYNYAAFAHEKEIAELKEKLSKKKRVKPVVTDGVS